MVLTMDQAVSHIHHTLLGPPSSELPAKQMVNQAGRHLVSMHAWEWLNERATTLGVVGTITIADGTWTSATKTLVKTGAFADYVFINGDEIEITDGTGATTGFRNVASRVDDDSITLETSFGADNTDTDATFTQPRVLLPADLRHIIGYNTTNSLVTGLKLTGLQDILDRRTSGIVASTWVTFGAVVHRKDTTVTDGTIVRPILELWPDPATTASREFTIFYMAKWTEVDDGDTLVLPDYCEDLFIALVRAYARGYEKEDEATVGMRVAAIKAGPLFNDAATMDGAMQPTLGPIERGAVQSGYAPLSYFLPNTLSGPV